MKWYSGFMKFHYVSVTTKTKRTTVYRTIIVFNSVLLIINVLLYAFITGPTVFFGRAENVNFQLRVCEQSGCSVESEGETPTTSTSADTGVPGSAFGVLVNPPISERSIITNVEEGIIPYIVVTSVSGQFVQAGKILRTYSREPVFEGKTNIIKAIIFLEFEGYERKIHTAFADQNGKWSFVSPIIFEPKAQRMFLTAISPLNPGFRAESEFLFDIVPIPPVALTPEYPPELPVISLPAPEPSKTSPVSKVPPPQKPLVPTPITVTEDLYTVYVMVDPLTKVIYPGENVFVETEIVRVLPPLFGEEWIDIQYRIYGPAGTIVYEKKESVLIQDRLLLKKQLSTSFNARAGTYHIIIELQRDGVTFVTSDTFEVRDKVLVSIPGLVITSEMASDILFRISFLAIMMILVFLSLLFWEYQKSKTAKKLDEHDLYRDRDIL